MRDSHGRELRYLRVSITDRCNLRCRYCMPEQGVPTLPHEEILTFDEIHRLVGIMVGMGVSRVRLTGGEPLVRRGVASLARQLKNIEGIRFLGLTTNGVLLDELAAPLCKAGVDGVNISLDTLNPQTYRNITRNGNINAVLKGIKAALNQPFQSVKINCVLAPGAQTEDWLGVVRLAQSSPLDVRLIEWMPLAGEESGPGACASASGGTASGAPCTPRALTADAALGILQQAFGTLRPVENKEAAGPAHYWQAPGFAGRIGLIPAMSHSFCAGCNRLRLTATGDLKLCLFYDTGVALKPLLRGGASDEEIRGAIRQAIARKPEKHRGVPKPAEDTSESDTLPHPPGMSGIGG